jgi:hypothetical protein
VDCGSGSYWNGSNSGINGYVVQFYLHSWIEPFLKIYLSGEVKMTYKGHQAAIVSSVVGMVDAHDGQLEQLDEKKNLIFKFPSAGAKHDCFDAIVSMCLTNVTLDKISGLQLSVSV